MAVAPSSSPLATQRLPRLAEQCRDLPAPVVRYLQRALGTEARPIAELRIEQTGTLRTSPDSQRWLRFDAVQQVLPQLRQFDWDARVRLAPLLHLRVRDAYAQGIGQGRVHLWSWLKLAAERDLPELNCAALHRFLAEAPWYPSALLPSAGVQWSAIDEAHACATLADGSNTVSLVFGFAANGDVESIHAADRWRRVGGLYHRCAWEGHFGDYQDQHGLRVPQCAQVGWYTGAQLHMVWRGQITAMAYQFA
jgi:hypothetical protein